AWRFAHDLGVPILFAKMDWRGLSHLDWHQAAIIQELAVHRRRQWWTKRASLQTLSSGVLSRIVKPKSHIDLHGLFPAVRRSAAILAKLRNIRRGLYGV